MYLLTKTFRNLRPHLLVSITNWKFIRFQQSNKQKLKMKIIKAPPIIPKTYEKKNIDLERVLSPHLTIYKPQISSMMSITVRMTGFTLGLMAWVVGITALLSEHNVDFFVDELKKQDLSDCYWTGAKIVVVFPFAFHFVSGMRHLLFDTSKLLEKPQFYATGYAAITLSCILAVCLGMIEDIRNKMDEMKQSDKTGK